MKQLLLALTIGLTAMGCRDKEEPQADCGCNAPSKDYVEYSAQTNEHLALEIYYDKGNSTYVMSGFPTNYSVPFASYICNEVILPQKIKNLKNTDQKLVVKAYTGFETRYCNSHLLEGILSHIHIKNIEVE